VKDNKKPNKVKKGKCASRSAASTGYVAFPDRIVKSHPGKTRLNKKLIKKAVKESPVDYEKALTELKQMKDACIRRN